MKSLPNAAHPILLRIDFSDDTKWQSLCEKAQAPSEDGFKAELSCINDTDYKELSVEKIISFASKEDYPIIFVADNVAILESDNAILCVDLVDDPGLSFRVLPCEMWGVENNLSLANMDYAEFFEAIDTDGIFRGFAL